MTGRSGVAQDDPDGLLDHRGDGPAVADPAQESIHSVSVQAGHGRVGDELVVVQGLAAVGMQQVDLVGGHQPVAVTAAGVRTARDARP